MRENEELESTREDSFMKWKRKKIDKMQKEKESDEIKKNPYEIEAAERNKNHLEMMTYTCKYKKRCYQTGFIFVSKTENQK